MDDLRTVLEDVGGAGAPREAVGRLRDLLDRELAHGAHELEMTRSGTERPVIVVIAEHPDGLAALAPVSPQLRADPAAIEERAWLLVAALTGALAEAGGSAPQVGTAAGQWLALVAPGAEDPELAVLAFEEEHASRIDRLRTHALAVPPALVEVDDPRPPIGPTHPLVVAHHVALLGGRPADARSVSEHEEDLLAVLQLESPALARPHDDPDPTRRIARRILQRLDGMGKWGGYHTDFAHLARGFAPSDRNTAYAIGEALLDAGLLREKPSVGQRHVFLDPGRKRDIDQLIDEGVVPADLKLPHP